MKRSEINPLPEYFDRYIDLVPDVEILEAFEASLAEIDALDAALLERIGGEPYAPGKWTPKQILQHVIDWERILSYRALLFARREVSQPQSIDENALAARMNAERRPAAALVAELRATRLSSRALFASFDREMLESAGVNWKHRISVLALGFAMLGHQIHHFRAIETHYYPLALSRTNL